MKGLFEIISRMASVHRYSNRFTVVNETIIDHTAVVQFLAMFIIDKLRSEGLFDKVGLTSEDELFLYRSITLHDMDEIVVGDIPRPTKYAMTDLRDLIHKIERSSMSNLVEVYNLPKEWYTVWNDAKKGKIGLILVVSDILSVVYKYWFERLILSNKIFDLVGNELSGELEVLHKSMTDMNDNFCSKYSIDPNEPYVKEYLYKMSEYIKMSIDILKESEKSSQFTHTGSVIGSF